MKRKAFVLFIERADHIVGTDHDDGRFGLDAVKVAIVQPPNDMLGAVAADSEIHGVALGIMLGPGVFAAAFPALSDGVADENEITVSLRHAFVEGLMPLGPTAAARYGFSGRMEFFLGDGGEGKEKGSQYENRFHAPNV